MHLPDPITGTNASSNTARLGSPRTVADSMQIAFYSSRR